MQESFFAKLLSNPSLLQASLGLGLAPHSLSSGTAMTATGNPTSLGTPLGPIIQVRCLLIPSRSPPGNGGPGIHGQSVGMRGESLVPSGGVGRDVGS